MQFLIIDNLYAVHYCDMCCGTRRTVLYFIIIIANQCKTHWIIYCAINSAFQSMNNKPKTNNGHFISYKIYFHIKIYKFLHNVWLAVQLPNKTHFVVISNRWIIKPTLTMICIWYKIYFHIKIYIFGTFWHFDLRYKYRTRLIPW